MGVSSPGGDTPRPGSKDGPEQRLARCRGLGGVCFLQKGLKNDGVQAETVASQNPGLKGLIGGPCESTRKYPPEQ